MNLISPYDRFHALPRISLIINLINIYIGKYILSGLNIYNFSPRDSIWYTSVKLKINKSNKVFSDELFFILLIIFE